MRAERASGPLPGLILLDVTRSLRRVRHPHPSGIDRVERAYLDFTLGHRGHLLARIGPRYFRLDAEGGRAFAAFLSGVRAPLDLAARLRPDRNRRLREGEALLRRHAIASGPLAEVLSARHRPVGAYLNIGHVGLGPAEMAGFAAAGVQRVAMLHDLIPLEHPEFARAGVPEETATRLSGACLADLVLTNSADTAERARDHALERGLPLPPVRALPLGVDLTAPGDAAAPPDPYFLCLGTIEPRKNHTLLLDLWEEGIAVDLHIAGRRGWRNAAVFARLDRGLTRVREHPAPSDARIAALIAGARALLLPSHAEGYGLPLAEALALGTPALVSDLPALREVGRAVPEYLDPQDQEAWRRALRDYASDTTRRAAQLARMRDWRAPLWSDHFAALEPLLHDLMLSRRKRG
ncbi:MAG: glycosyltransferase family 1 protein [Pseudomonadota bacterium]